MPIPSLGAGGEKDAPGKWLNWSQAFLAQPGLEPVRQPGRGKVGHWREDEGRLPPPHAWEQDVSPRQHQKNAEACGPTLQLVTCSGPEQQGWRVCIHLGDNGVVEIKDKSMSRLPTQPKLGSRLCPYEGRLR